MNKKAQRIAIAGACGKTIHTRHDWGEQDDRRYFICTRCGEYIGWGDYSKDKGVFNAPCPGDINNYPEDLNAMYEAEEQLIFMAGLKQILRWAKIIRDDPPNGMGIGAEERLHLTVAQRAEALLRALNLWKD